MSALELFLCEIIENRCNYCRDEKRDEITARDLNVGIRMNHELLECFPKDFVIRQGGVLSEKDKENQF